MNKGEFVDKLAERTGFTKKDSRKALDGVIDIVTEALESNEEVLLTGFGKFETRPRKATERINPQTQEKIKVPSKVVPAFKAGKNLRQGVKENLEAVDSGGGELKVKKA
ncbi:MAG: HU family DNA-binding protein [Candidatus Acetothermia bacterium]